MSNIESSLALIAKFLRENKINCFESRVEIGNEIIELYIELNSIQREN